jgi:ABC-type multidrug transport system permease subunit
MTEQVDSARGRQHNAFLQLISARVREFVREPAAIFWVYVFPLVLVVALGAAFRNQPVGDLRIVVHAAPGAQQICDQLNKDPRLDAVVCEAAECRVRLRAGRANLAIAIAEDSDSSYEYLFDPTQVEGVLARNAADDALQRAAGRQDVLHVEDRELKEPGSRYIDFLVPGLLGMGVLGGGMWGVGFAIVDMRIRKLLKRYLATPMKRSHFLAAVTASRLLFTLPEVLLVLVFARVFFGVVNHGSYLSLGLLIFLGALQFSGIGLLVASRAQTIETVSGLMNAVMIPMWIGSGIFFSAERFPGFVQPLLRLLPLTPLIDALRSVMLEGTSLVSLWAEVLMIVCWGAVTFVLAVRWFRWT